MRHQRPAKAQMVLGGCLWARFGRKRPDAVHTPAILTAPDEALRLVGGKVSVYVSSYPIPRLGNPWGRNLPLEPRGPRTAVGLDRPENLTRCVVMAGFEGPARPPACRKRVTPGQRPGWFLCKPGSFHPN